MQSLKSIKPEPNTITAQILEDADDNISYIKDAATHGCVGGNCRNLIYYEDTHKFYNKHADEIDEILQEYKEQTGEHYNILENMERLGQTDIRNFLAWLGYEIRAQEIMRELDPENY